MRIEVARRLEEAVPAGGDVGRLGDDEFVVLLESTRRKADVTMVAEQALAAIARAIVLGHKTSTISTSMGSAWAAGASALKPLGDADVSMHGAKKAGKNRYVAIGRAPSELARSDE